MDAIKLTSKKHKKRDYSPLPWHTYFDEKLLIKIEEDIFNVYKFGDSGPLLLLIHGGGYSGLTWSVFLSHLKNYSNCIVLAPDLRGHGETQTIEEYKLGLEVHCNDLKSVIEKIFNVDIPPMVIIGHSLGGAIATHLTSQNIFPTCCGLIVIDVVDEKAVKSYHGMKTLLTSRPTYFSSLEQAIEWSYRANQIRNVESARVSIPGQLKLIKKESLNTTKINYPGSIPEEGEDDEDNDTNSSASTTSMNSNIQYTWRIDLKQTEIFWKSWFENLTALFLSCKVPKILILNAVEKMDKDLIISQMQGKFEMHSLPDSGHAVQEDVPDKVANIVSTFMDRYKIAPSQKGFKTSNDSS